MFFEAGRVRLFLPALLLAACGGAAAPEHATGPSSEHPSASASPPPSASTEAGAAPQDGDATSVVGAWLMMAPTKGEEHEGGPLKITDDEFIVVREAKDGSRNLVVSSIKTREGNSKRLVLHLDNAGSEVVCGITPEAAGKYTAQCSRAGRSGTMTQDYALDRIADPSRVKELEALLADNRPEAGACAKLEPCCKVTLQAKSKSAACDFADELRRNNQRTCTDELRAMRQFAQQNGKSLPKPCQ